MRVTKGLRRLLERDPVQRLFDDLELAQRKANPVKLRQVLRVPPRVQVGWIHVTDTLVPCDRLVAAALLGLKPPWQRESNPLSQRVMDNGTYMHLRYQVYFRCLPLPYEVEAPKLLKRWPVVGEADVAIRHPELGNWLVELKSLNTLEWRSLSAPARAWHQTQLNSYLGLVGRGWGGQLWYENKNNQEVKRFLVEFNAASWMQTWTRASVIAWGLIAGKVPPSCGSCLDPEFCEGQVIVSSKQAKELHERYAAAHTHP